MQIDIMNDDLIRVMAVKYKGIYSFLLLFQEFNKTSNIVMFLLLLGRHGSFYEKCLRNEHRWQENISAKYYLNNIWKIVY